jgi:hypothetical protein
MLIFTLLILISCGKMQGRFAVKTITDENYRAVNENLEIEKGTELKWIYKFKNVSSRYAIGIILVKKELFWVEVKNGSDYVERKKNIISGTIDRLPVGEYKIILTDLAKKNRLIDEMQFVVYSDRVDD